MALADLNGDGNVDLVTANNSDGTLSIFYGNGNGTFQSPLSVYVGVGIDAVVAGQFDDNGTTDLAVANYNTGTVSIVSPGPAGTWVVGAPISVGANPFYITTGSFTSSGLADLATAGFGSGVSVLLNNGSGAFQPAVTYAAGTYLTAIVAPDVAYWHCQAAARFRGRSMRWRARRWI